MPNVFISYRRSDTTAGYASWLYDRLAGEFGADHVFMDIDSLALGVDFVDQLDKALAAADVALILIGPGWLQATNDQGKRRLDDPDDFVHIEVAAALRASVRVIPVLVDGAAMPSSAALPTDLTSLARRQGLTFDRHGGRAIDELLGAIEQVTGPQAGNGAKDHGKVAGAPRPPGAGAERAPLGGQQPATTTKAGFWHRLSRGWKIAIAIVVLLIVIGAIGAATSSTSHAYPSNVQTNFLNACEAKGSVATCDCDLSWLEQHVSLTKFQQEDANVRNGGTLPVQWDAAFVDCAAKNP